MKDNILKISTQTGNLFNECTNDAAYLNECYAYLRACGFEAIDYNIDHFTNGCNIKDGDFDCFWSKSLDELYEYFSPTKAAVESNGLAFSQTHASFPVYYEGKDDVNDFFITLLEKNLAVCAFLGCPALVVHPFRCNDPKHEAEANLTLYRRLIPAAKKYGVTVCLENSYAEILWDCNLIDRLNDEAGAKCFGYCLDIGHANCGGGKLGYYIRTLGDRLTCLHIHDNDSANDSHLIPFTQTRGGWHRSTDYYGMLDALREIGYSGNLSFETFHGVELLPKAVEKEALCLISAIGRHFREVILNPEAK